LVFDAPFATGVRFALPATVGLRRVEEAPNLVLEDVLRLPRAETRKATPLEIDGVPTHVVVAAGSRPRTHHALSHCITPDADLVEVVWVDEREVILVRPERIHAARTS